jgi:hypothetical protein
MVGSLGRAVAGSPIGVRSSGGGGLGPRCNPGRGSRGRRLISIVGPGFVQHRVTAPLLARDARSKVRRLQLSGADSLEITTAARRQSSSKPRRSSTSAMGRPPAPGHDAADGIAADPSPKGWVVRSTAVAVRSQPLLDHEGRSAPEKDQAAVDAAQRPAGALAIDEELRTRMLHSQGEPRRDGRKAEEPERRRQQGQKKEGEGEHGQRAGAESRHDDRRAVEPAHPGRDVQHGANGRAHQ